MTRLEVRESKLSFKTPDDHANNRALNVIEMLVMISFEDFHLIVLEDHHETLRSGSAGEVNQELVTFKDPMLRTTVLDLEKQKTRITQAVLLIQRERLFRKFGAGALEPCETFFNNGSCIIYSHETILRKNYGLVKTAGLIFRTKGVNSFL